MLKFRDNKNNIRLQYFIIIKSTLKHTIAVVNIICTDNLQLSQMNKQIYCKQRMYENNKKWKHVTFYSLYAMLLFFFKF
jgi:hypothetical protein